MERSPAPAEPPFSSSSSAEGPVPLPANLAEKTASAGVAGTWEEAATTWAETDTAPGGTRTPASTGWGSWWLSPPGSAFLVNMHVRTRDVR